MPGEQFGVDRMLAGGNIPRFDQGDLARETAELEAPKLVVGLHGRPHRDERVVWATLWHEESGDCAVERCT
ncbi:hypothetical protein D3C75_933750 [compost metagenome]